MQKKVFSLILIISLVSILSISLVSASWLGDLWAKISGKEVSLSPINPDLLLYMNFNTSKAKDYSGNGFNGVLNNVKYNAAGGIKDGAFDFSGNIKKPSHIDFGSMPGIDTNLPTTKLFKIKDAITISMWVKKAKLNQGRVALLAETRSQADGAGAFPYYLEANNNHVYKLTIQNSSGYNVLAVPSSKARTESLDWDFVVATYDSSIASNNARIYVNGILVANSTFYGKIKVYNTYNSAYMEASQSVVLGGSSTYGWFNGTIDEVKIWKKALTLGEIQAEYTALSGHITTSASTQSTQTTTCTDPDANLPGVGGVSGIFTKTTVRGPDNSGKILQITDSCSSYTDLSEAYCSSDGYVSSNGLECPYPHNCTNGACIKPVCDDPDVNELGGISGATGIYRKTTTTGFDNSGNAVQIEDSCSSNTELSEAYCTSDFSYVSTNSITCPKGCLNGACIR